MAIEIGQFLFDWAIPYVMLLLSGLGGLIGNLIFARKELENFPCRRSYQALLSIDFIYTAKVVIQFSFINVGIYLKLMTDWSCKVYIYTNFMICSVSSWLLVFISIQRCLIISIKVPPPFINSKTFDYLIISVSFLYNIIFYLPFLLFNELKVYNVYNDTNTNMSVVEYTCDFPESSQGDLFYLLDMLSSTLVPFGIMVVSSVVLMTFVIKSRLRVLTLGRAEDRRVLRKDIRICLTIVFLNVFFIILNLPICVGNYLDTDYLNYFIYSTFFYIFLFSFSINFYILAVFNNIVKRNLISMMKTIQRKIFFFTNNTSL